MQKQYNTEYHISQDRMALLPNYYKWIYRQVSDAIGGMVAELGAGAGHFLPHYLRQAKHVFAVDYNDQLLTRIRELFPATSVTAMKQDLRDHWRGLETGQFDTVIALDVLEHMEDDHAFLYEVHRILKPGGRVILKVPANPELFSAMDIASGHFRRYDLVALEAVMSGSGFRTYNQRHFNKLGAAIYRVKKQENSTFSRSLSPGLLKLANLSIPAIALCDTLMRSRGLSIIGVYLRI